MQPLRLLYALQGQSLGGSSLHAIDLARRLALRGHHVTATCRPDATAIRRALESAAGPLQGGVHCALTYVELAALIDRVRPQLIQHFDGWIAPAAVELAQHPPRSVQLIHANHGLAASGKPIPTQGTDLLVAVSDSAARFYPRRAPQPPLQVIWNGVDTDRYAPAAVSPVAPPIRLLSVGRLCEASKRVSTLVDTCAELPASCWQLTLIGDGPDRDALARRVRERGLHNVTLLAHRDDPAPHYQAAHVYLSASVSEGFGRSLAEAAAAGLAIAARRCHGITDRLEHDVHALLASSDAELVDALRRLIADAALRERLGRAARRFAVSNLGVERMLDAYEQLYRELLAGRATERAESSPGSTEISAC